MDGGARLKLSNEFKSPLENMVIRKLGKFRAEKPGPTEKYLASLPMGRHEAGRELQRAEEDAMLASIAKAKAVREAKSAGFPAAAAYLSASGRKRSARKVAIMEGPMLGGTSCGGRKPSARGAIVKKVMREQGLSLPQASKYVKDNGLY
jgi:hypothetical protein